ncbi:MAG: hypothetical protein WCP65_00080 [Bacteroidota bacterium]
MINTGAISKALRPGVNSWFGLAYNQYPEEYKQIFDTMMSSMNFEEDVNVNGFGLAAVKPEGMALSYDSMQQGFLKRYVHVTYALGYVISREAIEDNLYIKLAQQRSEALARSMKQTKENVAANILNRAFNSSYTGADALELCSTAHLLSKGGTFSNKIATAADLSEASLEQALIDIAGFVDDANLRMSARGMKLIIPRQLQFEAQRILKNMDRPGTAERDINAMVSLGMLPGGIVMNHYLTDTDAFFIKTDVAEGLKHFSRRALEIKDDSDFDTENVKFKASERFSFGWTDPRGIYGSPGA